MPENGDIALPAPDDPTDCDYYTWSDAHGWMPTLGFHRGVATVTPPAVKEEGQT